VLDHVGLATWRCGLQKGLNHRIGPGGHQLSGGQRQRLGIGRAILQRPRILILDEATSSLDASLEQQVLGSLRRILPGTTVIVISHRLSALRCVDRVIILSAGRIVEDDLPTALLANSDAYSRLFSAGGTARRMYLTCTSTRFAILGCWRHEQRQRLGGLVYCTRSRNARDPPTPELARLSRAVLRGRSTHRQPRARDALGSKGKTSQSNVRSSRNCKSGSQCGPKFCGFCLVVDASPCRRGPHPAHGRHTLDGPAFQSNPTVAEHDGCEL
jgi:hypothetical protein